MNNITLWNTSSTTKKTAGPWRNLLLKKSFLHKLSWRRFHSVKHEELISTNFHKIHKTYFSVRFETAKPQNQINLNCPFLLFVFYFYMMFRSVIHDVTSWFINYKAGVDFSWICAPLTILLFDQYSSIQLFSNILKSLTLLIWIYEVFVGVFFWLMAFSSAFVPHEVPRVIAWKEHVHPLH